MFPSACNNSCPLVSRFWAKKGDATFSKNWMSYSANTCPLLYDLAFLSTNNDQNECKYESILHLSGTGLTGFYQLTVSPKVCVFFRTDWASDITLLNSSLLYGNIYNLNRGEYTRNHSNVLISSCQNWTVYALLLVYKMCLLVGYIFFIFFLFFYLQPATWALCTQKHQVIKWTIYYTECCAIRLYFYSSNLFYLA